MTANMRPRVDMSTDTAAIDRKQALRNMIAEHMSTYREQHAVAADSLQIATHGCGCDPDDDDCRCPGQDDARRDAATAAMLAQAAATAAHTIALLLTQD